MKRILIVFLVCILASGLELHAQSDSIVSASGEIGGRNGALEFLGETGIITQFPRLTDAGELLYYAPIVTTDSASILTRNPSSAIAYGNILFNGWYDEVFQRGFQISSTFDFSSDVQTYIVDSNSLYADCEHPCAGNVFSFIFSGLSANTTYYVRAYATNSAGTAYGEIRSFTIADPCNPYLVGRVASTSSAIDGSDLAETIVEYNTNTDTASLFEFFVRKNNCADCGIKISLEVDMYVVDENSNESLMSNVTDYADLSFASYLDMNYIRWTPADASSISIPGHYVSFNGISQRLNYFNLCYADPDYPCNPTPTAASQTALPFYGPNYDGAGAPNLGRVNGIKVNSWRQPGTYKFVVRLARRDDSTAYALTTRDWCLENQLGGHSATLTSLVYDTLTFWVYVDTATNDGQPCPGTPTLTDVDGNTYNTVQIGNQCWMKENLRTSTNGAGTGNIYTPTTTGYDVETYGRLYDWDAVMQGASSSDSIPSGVQGICPTGWHVPSDNEWKQMEMAVGMSQSDADNTGSRGNIAAKLCGNTGWDSSTTANTAGNLNAPDRNFSGFSALPAGVYYSSYGYFGHYAYFWSATENSSDFAYTRSLYYYYAGVARFNDPKSFGSSVRCVRD